MRIKTSQQADKMLEAAGRLFGGQRFHEVRMEDIAAEARVGKGTIYRYFADKEELYHSLLERASKQILDRISRSMEPVQGARSKLAALVSAIVEYFDEQPHLFDLIQRAEVLRGPSRTFPWQHTRDEVMQIVLQLFTDAGTAGEFTVRDPRMLALMLLGGLRAVIRFGERPRPRNLGERLVTAFLEGAAD